MDSKLKRISPDQYEILKQDIAAGHFGTVSKGKLLSTGEQIAIKVFKEPITNSKDEQAFWKEVQFLDSINHPACLSLIGYDIQPEDQSHGPIIITPYMKCGTLADRIELCFSDDDYLLTPTQQTIIIYGIARALAYLHQRNILHRDLKPSNVFLNDNLEPIVSDFGLSRSWIPDSDFILTPSVGTPFYIAPEVSTGHYTEKVDVFSFGMLLPQIFTNEKHLDDENYVGAIKRENVNQRIESGSRPPQPAQMPDNIYEVATYCWKQDPNERLPFSVLCSCLETEEYHVKGTDENAFEKYKKKIDEAENQNKS